MNHRSILGALNAPSPHSDVKQPSEIMSELSNLDSAIDRLGAKQEQLAQRLQPISKGKPPRPEMKANGVSPVLGSDLARQIEALRFRVNAITDLVEAEYQALAL